MMREGLRRRVLLALSMTIGVMGTALPVDAAGLVISAAGTETQSGDISYIHDGTTSDTAGDGISFESDDPFSVPQSYTYTINSTGGSVVAQGYRYGASIGTDKTLTVTAAKNIDFTATGTPWESSDEWGYYSYVNPTGMEVTGGTVNLEAAEGITIKGNTYGVYADGSDFNTYNTPDVTTPGVTITMETDADNVITSNAVGGFGSGVAASAGVNLTMTAGGSNRITAMTTDTNDYLATDDMVNGMSIGGSSDLPMTSFGNITLTAGKDNIVEGSANGLIAAGEQSIEFDFDDPTAYYPTLNFLHSNITMDAAGDNQLIGEYDTGIDLYSGTAATLTAGGTNIIQGAQFGAHVDYFADLTVNGNSDISSQQFALWTAGKADTTLDGQGGTISITAASSDTSSDNIIPSTPIAVTSLTGGYTTLQNGTLKINGPTALLAAHTYYQGCVANAFPEFSSYSSGITVASVSVVQPALYAAYVSYTMDNENRASVITALYGKDSEINGDIYAYDHGTITIAPEDDGNIDINGDVFASGNDLLAGEDPYTSPFYLNNPTDSDITTESKVDITLDNASTLVGMADDGTLMRRAYLAAGNVYSDYGVTDEEWEYITPEAGILNLTLNNGSEWTMTDSSSVTTLSGSGGYVTYENGGNSLEIENLSGNLTFSMDLDAEDGSQSDMLYVVNGGGTQTLNVKNIQSLDSQMEVGDVVRFATIKNSQNEFVDGSTVAVVTSGIYNSTYNVLYRDYESDPLNTEEYNNDRNGGAAYTEGSSKPGTEIVESLYGGEGAKNVYLIKNQTVNDGAKTPSRVRDLVWRYMSDLDTFTKRSGQSQYFTDEGDRGGWIRLGYHNLGVDGVGELEGNTYELGWTTIARQNDERKHRFSASVAYGKPDGYFEDWGGDLTVRDFSVNLYDTHEYYPSAESLADKPEWKKESHAYWDNYLKYHHVKTEYSAIDRMTGTKYDGDYDQDIWSLSTEYGHKLMMNKDWFWVPQAQLQLSYIGGYDYKDSQGLSVSGDHDWSLIGRLGFDIVKKMDQKLDSKLYFKAGLLHEFMDGNDVTVSAQGDRYLNEGDQSGTWGVFGLGYSAKIGEQQYFYVDFERYVGNDFERTYNIRAGVNWKF
jgi:outer membrane autotransporter protein